MAAVRKLIMTAVALLAVRMAARALKRGAGDYAAITAALWAIAGQLALAGTANTAKTRAVEDRLNALVPRIPVPQTAPGTTASGASATSNSSYSMGGGTNVSYNPSSSGNEGGTNSETSGQIGGASAHYHSMTHYHTSSGDLQNVFNATQGSYSSTVPALNDVISDHVQLLADHNNLKAALIASGVLQ